MLNNTMKHKCTNCGKLYDEQAAEIIKGCICGNNRYYFVNTKKSGRKKMRENEYFYEFEDEQEHELIVFDSETINIIEQGKYEIDIHALFNNRALVYKYKEGKYGIDLASHLNKKITKAMLKETRKKRISQTSE